MLVQRGIRGIPILFVRTNERTKAIKGKARRSMQLSYSKHCSCVFVYVYMLCNLISSPIDIQYDFHINPPTPEHRLDAQTGKDDTSGGNNPRSTP